MKLAEYIKLYRQENKITMDEFANMCGLSKAYISMLEKGRHPQNNKKIAPTIDTYKKIAAAIGCSLQDLFSDLDSDDVSLASNNNILSKQEERLLAYYRLLSGDGQGKVNEYIKDLVASGRYESTDGKYKHDYIIYPGTPKAAEALVEYNSSTYEPETIAAHHEGDWTKEELEEVEEFKKYVKDKNKNK